MKIEEITAIKEFNKRRYEYLKKHKKTKPFDLKPIIFQRQIMNELRDLYAFYERLVFKPEFIDNSDMAYEIFLSYVKDLQLRYNIRDEDIKILLIKVSDEFNVR